MVEKLIITENAGHTQDIFLYPNTQPYIAKRAELIGAGMSESEAERYLLTTPIPIEFYYSSHQGLFAVESEILEQSEIYNPYTGEEIPNENLPQGQ